MGQSGSQHSGDEERQREQRHCRVERERQRRDRPRDRTEPRQRSIQRADRKIEDSHRDRATQKPAIAESVTDTEA